MSTTVTAIRSSTTNFLPLINYPDFGPNELFFADLNGFEGEFEGDPATGAAAMAVTEGGASGWGPTAGADDRGYPFYFGNHPGTYWLPSHVANLGHDLTDQREDWWGIINTAVNSLIRAQQMGLTGDEWGYDYMGPPAYGGGNNHDRFTRSAGGCFSGLPRIDHLTTSDGGATPDCFVLDFEYFGSTEEQGLDGALWPLRVVLKTVILHNILFGTELQARSDDKNVLYTDQLLFGYILSNVRDGLDTLELIIAHEVALADEAAAAAEIEGEAPPVGFPGVFMYEPLRTFEIETMKTETKYNQYFSTTFNKDVITTVPLIHNFYLTSVYFDQIRQSFDSTKSRALAILMSNIRNDDNFDNTPNLTRPSARAAVADSTGVPDPEEIMKEYILKALLETPLNILKGVAELIDPHLAISKIIKAATADAFKGLARIMQPGADKLNELRLEAMEGLASEQGPSNPDLPMGDVITSGEQERYREITGEDLLAFMLCVVDQGFEAADKGIQNSIPGVDPAAVPPHFFPDISMDGVDFAGSVAGMLMMPPTPLGMVYLLLQLIKNNELDQLENVEDAGPEAAEATEC